MLSQSRVPGLMNANRTSQCIDNISACSGKSVNISHFLELCVMKLPTYIPNCLFSSLDYYDCSSLFSGGFWNKLYLWNKVPACSSPGRVETLLSRCWRCDSVCWPALWWLHGVEDVHCRTECPVFSPFICSIKLKCSIRFVYSLSDSLAGFLDFCELTIQFCKLTIQLTIYCAMMWIEEKINHEPFYQAA